MTDDELKVMLQTALEPYVKAFLRKPGQASLSVTFLGGGAKVKAVLRLVQSDRNWLSTSVIKAHLDDAFNTLALHHSNKTALGIELKVPS